jgi:transcriptional regulator GlxA family with amidase domain
MDGTARSLARRHVASISRQEAVERAEAYMRAHITTPVPLSRLCRLVGLSERGLREAFYGVRGMSPKRWSVGVRLQCVRQALTDERRESTTVTDAAADYGFYELGRFAAIYREAFGEAPSDTLRSTNHRTAATSRSSTSRRRTRQCLLQHVP